MKLESGPHNLSVILATEDFLKNRGRTEQPLTFLHIESAVEMNTLARPVVVPTFLDQALEAVKPERTFLDDSHLGTSLLLRGLELASATGFVK